MRHQEKITREVVRTASYTCDLCGKDITLDVTSDWTDASLAGVAILASGGYGSRFDSFTDSPLTDIEGEECDQLDFCDDCFQLLLNWIAEKRAKNARAVQ